MHGYRFLLFLTMISVAQAKCPPTSQLTVGQTGNISYASQCSDGTCTWMLSRAKQNFQQHALIIRIHKIDLQRESKIVLPEQIEISKGIKRQCYVYKREGCGLNDDQLIECIKLTTVIARSLPSDISLVPNRYACIELNSIQLSTEYLPCTKQADPYMVAMIVLLLVLLLVCGLSGYIIYRLWIAKARKTNEFPVRMNERGCVELPGNVGDVGEYDTIQN